MVYKLSPKIKSESLNCEVKVFYSHFTEPSQRQGHAVEGTPMAHNVSHLTDAHSFCLLQMLKINLCLFVGVCMWGFVSSIRCPDGKICQDLQTCCLAKQGYGCCPYPRVSKVDHEVP